MWLKQLYNHKIWDFPKAFLVQKRFGTFEKQVPGEAYGNAQLCEWVDKQKFAKAVVSRIVCLQECPLKMRA